MNGYIKLRRTGKSFTELAGESLPEGEPIVINKSGNQYLIVGGLSDGTVSNTTKVVKFLSKDNSEIVVFYSGTKDAATLQNEAAEALTLTNSISGQANKVANKLTVNAGNAGDTAFTYDGSAAKTVSANSVGAVYKGATSGITNMDNTNASGAANNVLYVVGNSEPVAAHRNKLSSRYLCPHPRNRGILWHILRPSSQSDRSVPSSKTGTGFLPFPLFQAGPGPPRRPARTRSPAPARAPSVNRRFFSSYCHPYHF